MSELEPGNAAPAVEVARELPWRSPPGEDAWARLSVAARRALLEPLQEQGGGVTPADEAVPEALARELATAGFLVRVRSATGCHFGLDPAALPLVSWLLDLRELELLSEKPELARWIERRFPGERAPAELEARARDPLWRHRAVPAPSLAEALILGLLARTGGRVAARELVRLVPRVGEAALDRARARLEEQLVLFHGLDPETLELELGFLAPVRRPAEPAPRPRLEPLAKVPETVFERAVFQADLAAFLLELAREPVRVKKTHELFEKARLRLEGALEPLPGWVEAIGYLPRARRLELALRTAHLAKLSRTREGEVALAPAGRELLGRPRAERLATFPAPAPSLASRHDETFLGVPASSVVLADPRARGHGAHPPSEHDVAELRRAVARAFEAIEPGRFFDLEAFTRFACAEAPPLLRGSEPARVVATLGLRLIPPVREEIEAASRLLLRHLVAGPLVHVGGVALGRLEDGSFAFALTPLGRVYLGLDPALAPDAAPVPAEAIVQPNFDVVVLAPEPAVLAELAPFTEAAGGAAGDPARTLRLTRASVQAAAGAGLGADAILGTLARLSRTGVPENVARGVRDWATAVRRASVASGSVLELPDAETLERVQAALGAAARPLPLALSIAGLKPAELRRRLAKLGIVLDAP